MLTKDEINFFLQFGYIPKFKKNSIFNMFDIKNLKNKTLQDNLSKLSERKIIELGIISLKSCFDVNYEKHHVVPLSGGLDSRLILAELVNKGLKKKITTISFGLPSSYDYKIAKMISKRFGIKHIRINLSKIPLDEESLLNIARNGSSFTFLFDAYYNSLVNKRLGEKYTYWSGFAGDPLAGSHLPLHENQNWSEAIDYFLKWNKLNKFINEDFSSLDISKILPSIPFVDKSLMSYDDQLDFGIRQQNYIKKVVIFKGYEYKTPFLEDAWVKFIFNIPRKYRLNQYIYKKILLNGYSEFFSMPTTNNFGCSISTPNYIINFHRMLYHMRLKIKHHFKNDFTFLDNFWDFFKIYDKINYIDFNEAIRLRDDYKILVKNNLKDLKERNLLTNIDLKNIYKRHLTNKSNYGYFLLLATALEISLKSNNL